MATSSYKSDNDIYLEFIRDCVEIVDDKEKAKTSFIRLADMYAEFKDWYKENHPSYSKNMVGKNIMKKQLNRRLGVIKEDTDIYGFGTSSRWWGYKIAQPDDQKDAIQRVLSRT